jgi:hypothetical protein
MTTDGDAFGSLAALFTSGGNGTARHGGAAADGVGLLLAGNLPVMAGLWITQFADEASRTAGPTALVRFDRDEVTVELLRADGRQVPPVAPGALSRWLPRAAGSMRRWIVCMPADADPAAAVAAGLPLTLLTGADEAAVTGAYLRLKQLADAAIHGGAPLERVSVSVVGATPPQATAAASRLADAARSFLGIEVELVSTPQRVERAESSARASYPVDDCPAPADFLAELLRARAESATRFDDAGPEPTSFRFDAPIEPKPAAPEAAMHAPHHAPRTAAPLPPHAHAPAAPAPRPAAPAPAFAALPVADLPARLVPLLRGLRPLGISCPVAPEVELALDADRRMHIVGRSDQLAKVRTAHTWASMHRELLGMAFAELKGGFEVRERILLGDAREAITLHGTGVLLDVLVFAETPAGIVQVVVPLNDPTSCG